MGGTKMVKAKKTTTTKREDDAVNHAKHFMQLKQTLDNLKENYREFFNKDIDVGGIMEECAVGDTVEKPKSECVLSTLDSPKSCPTRDVPQKIVDAIKLLALEDQTLTPWLPEKRGEIPHTWFVCYINDTVPNTKKRGWEKYHCSRRCRNTLCVAGDHLCWESHKERLSRNNDFCRAPCPNGEDCEYNCVNTCHCQDTHKPHCL